MNTHSTGPAAACHVSYHGSSLSPAEALCIHGTVPRVTLDLCVLARLMRLKGKTVVSSFIACISLLTIQIGLYNQHTAFDLGSKESLVPEGITQRLSYQD